MKKQEKEDMKEQKRLKKEQEKLKKEREKAEKNENGESNGFLSNIKNKFKSEKKEPDTSKKDTSEIEQTFTQV